VHKVITASQSKSSTVHSKSRLDQGSPGTRTHTHNQGARRSAGEGARSVLPVPWGRPDSFSSSRTTRRHPAPSQPATFFFSHTKPRPVAHHIHNQGGCGGRGSLGSSDAVGAIRLLLLFNTACPFFGLFLGICCPEGRGGEGRGRSQRAGTKLPRSSSPGTFLLACPLLLQQAICSPYVGHDYPSTATPSPSMLGSSWYLRHSLPICHHCCTRGGGMQVVSWGRGGV
jgi:hypothetical protein